MRATFKLSCASFSVAEAVLRLFVTSLVPLLDRLTELSMCTLDSGIEIVDLASLAPHTKTCSTLERTGRVGTHRQTVTAWVLPTTLIGRRWCICRGHRVRARSRSRCDRFRKMGAMKRHALRIVEKVIDCDRCWVRPPFFLVLHSAVRLKENGPEVIAARQQHKYYRCFVQRPMPSARRGISTTSYTTVVWIRGKASSLMTHTVSRSRKRTVVMLTTRKISLFEEVLVVVHPARSRGDCGSSGAAHESLLPEPPASGGSSLVVDATPPRAGRARLGCV